MIFTRLSCRELERPAGDFADPEGSHELQARKSAEVLRVPFPERRVLGGLSDNRVLHNCVAEVVNNRGNCENATEPIVETFFGHISGVK